MRSVTPEGKLAELLSVEYHRKQWPVVKWIENKMKAGDTDYGEYLPEVVDRVEVVLGGAIGLSYAVDRDTGQVNSVLPENRVHDVIDNVASPTEEEIRLFGVLYPEEFKALAFFCGRWDTELFRRPHSCNISYKIIKEECSGCGRSGHVNYHIGDGRWGYFCGGSDRCIP